MPTPRPKATRAYRAGRDHFDRFGYREYPLSGEWAGESMTELSADYSLDLFDDDIATLFEEGFYAAASESDAQIALAIAKR